MTKDEIISMAREAGLTVKDGLFREIFIATGHDLARFAALVAQREREECLAEIETGIWMDKSTEEVLDDIAAAIRARGEVRG